ncbi:MAG: hypothetical protein WEC79_06605 [Thermomicrobiales bacterium]
MTRAQLLRKLVVLSTAVSFVLGVFGGGAALAADSRILYIGSGPLPAGNGVLTPTAVTQGGTTRIDVTVLSGDNQNIAHTVLFFPINGTSLASGLTVSYVFGSDASFCDPTGAASATSVQCDFGSLAAGASRTVSILVDVAGDFSLLTPTPLFTANVETNNENGSNNQIFQATSESFAVDPSSDNDLGTYVEPGLTTAQTVGTAGAQGAGNKLTTAVTFQPSQANGNLVSIAEALGTTFGFDCPSGLNCQPDATTVDIDGGTGSFDTSPYLTWRLTAQVPKTFTLSKAFVAHYPTGSTTSDWQLFWKDKSGRCGTDPGATVEANGQCLLSATLSKPDKATGLATLVIEVLTDHNGGMRF